jgi:predicted nuclease with TOPRIM domain
MSDLYDMSWSELVERVKELEGNANVQLAMHYKDRIDELEAEVERLDTCLDQQLDVNEKLADENERLNNLAKDAILSLTDEVGVGEDPVAFVCAAYVHSRAENERLRGDLEIMRLQRDATHVSRCPKCAALEDDDG